MIKFKDYLLSIYSLAAVLILDQLSKIVVANSLMLGQSKPFIPGIISFVKVHNDGTIWGIGKGGNLIFAFLAIVVVALIIIFAPRITKSPISKIALGMVIGGAIGNNLIDRLVRGFVIDFLHVDFFDFPVFNVADIAIVLGAITLALVMLIEGDKPKKQEI
ncbi:MAG TPA: signal peptidase II [Caldisericia bacterium]|nr:signal peptidase II [Caldisericia bacterium]HPF48258.1 signal peptidase II [Caldisericia bacterium]HPI83806.1 signal peptidase II [Caldisericia bacterium]HPQ92711.1 signal peptidase II [Caldisericia bacterium]HRV74191.1 signal peptidase II [Caldisericia bacterium]